VVGGGAVCIGCGRLAGNAWRERCRSDRPTRASMEKQKFKTVLI